MSIRGCIPIVPSADLERSLPLWREGLGFDKTWWESRRDGKLVGCGIANGAIRIMLNIRAGDPARPEAYEGVRFYWTPDDFHALHARLLALGYAVSDIRQREYRQTEFFLTDGDGFEHCFGVPTDELEMQP